MIFCDFIELAYIAKIKSSRKLLILQYLVYLIQGNALLEQGYLSESDCITSFNSGTEPIFWCSNNGDCESTNYYIDHPFDGARCALGGVTGDAVRLLIYRLYLNILLLYKLHLYFN